MTAEITQILKPKKGATRGPAAAGHIALRKGKIYKVSKILTAAFLNFIRDLSSTYLPFWIALICILGAGFMWYLTRERGPAPIPEPYKDDKGRLVYSIAALQRFDGRNNADKKMYMGLKGKVYDVTKSPMLGVPGEHYAKIWAGKDCTVSMCLLSLKAEDANRTDWDAVQKENVQYRKALLSWVKHFHDKYPVVGYVEEYIKDGRDLEAEDKQDLIEIEEIEKAKAAEKAAILEKKKREAAAKKAAAKK